MARAVRAHQAASQALPLPTLLVVVARLPMFQVLAAQVVLPRQVTVAPQQVTLVEMQQASETGEAARTPIQTHLIKRVAVVRKASSSSLGLGPLTPRHSSSPTRRRPRSSRRVIGRRRIVLNVLALVALAEAEHPEHLRAEVVEVPMQESQTQHSQPRLPTR